MFGSRVGTTCVREPRKHPRKQLAILACSLVFGVFAQRAEALVINEVVTTSRLAGRDADGDASDWLELLHTGEAPLDLAGYGLTDNAEEPGKWLFPAVTLRPGEHLIVWCSGKDLTSPELHASFRLNRDGETLILTDPAGTLLDLVDVPPLTEDHAWGRAPDGAETFGHLVFPTPGESNDPVISDRVLPREVSFEPEPGLHATPVEVELTADIAVAEGRIRYTLDGTTPTGESPLYEGPISITTDTVIRAAGFVDTRLATRIVSQSYFVSELAHTLELPIVSLSMEPDEFVFVHNTTIAQGRTFEREAFLEFFTPEGEPLRQTGFGIRLHGGAGRRGRLETKKAYRAYFRDVYGVRRLENDILPNAPVDSFDKIVLRPSYADTFRIAREGTFLRDQIVRELHADMGAITSHGVWYNLFVNMEYRGIYNIVERIDEEFLDDYIPNDDAGWHIIKTGNEAPPEAQAEWEQLLAFFADGDFSDETAFAAATSRVDLDSFTTYMILNIWAQNHDWPQNNWYAMRSRKEGARWFFLVWDAECGMGLRPRGFLANTFQHVFFTTAPFRIILEGLLENAGYREFFATEMERHFQDSLTGERVLRRVRDMRELIRADLAMDSLALAGRPLEIWEANVDLIEDFAANRTATIRNYILESRRIDFNAFSRGDANGDGRLDISDPIKLLGYLAGLDFEPLCSDALDADDSGQVDLTDPTYLFNFLFTTAPPPVAPYALCGLDPSEDKLGCDTQNACP